MLSLFCGFSYAQNHSANNFTVASQIDVFSAILKELDLFYVDSLDARKTARAGIDAMLRQLDPYTVYYSQDDMGELKMMTTGKYAGIGSMIRQYRKDQVIIAEPYEGSPSAKVGLKVGDVLLDIDGKDLRGKTTSEVSDMLKGDPQTSFVLKVQRPGVDEPLEFKITRETITTPAVPYYGLLTPKVGYINFTQFTDNCSAIIRRALIEMRQQGATSLVLDLRDNGGGLLVEAQEVVNLFVPKGKSVVKQVGKHKSASSEYITKKEPLDLEMPVVVLVNGNTASSSEIVSGALQDLDRAVIMGSRTYGKGLVQSARDLPYNGNIKLTTAKYYLPSGRCVQAIDYSHRNESGRAERIADSLTHVFHTEAGREMRDGGGIRPDIEAQEDTVANITAYLSADEVLIDYGTQYCLKHEAPATVADFQITDADFEEFCEMIKKSDFKYDKQTESLLKRLKDMAGFEGYLKDAEAEFEALEKKLNHNIDFDLQQNKEDIKLLMASEIVKRYFYQAGTVQESIKHDKLIQQAVELLADEAKYKDLLKKK